MNWGGGAKKGAPPRLTSNSSYELALGSSQLGRLLEPSDRLVDLALLQRELGERSHGDVAVGVELKCFLAVCLGLDNVLFPLESREGFVDERKDVAGAPEVSSLPCVCEESNYSLVLVQLEGAVKALDTLLVLALVEQQFTAVISTSS